MKPGDENDEGCNLSHNQTFAEVMSLSRRQVVLGGIGSVAMAMLQAQSPRPDQLGLIGFTSVPLTGEDRVIVPDGYSAEILYAWGDPVSAGPEWDTNALDTWIEQDSRRACTTTACTSSRSPMARPARTAEAALIKAARLFVDPQTGEIPQIIVRAKPEPSTGDCGRCDESDPSHPYAQVDGVTYCSRCWNAIGRPWPAAPPEPKGPKIGISLSTPWSVR